jgi:hypothetical protein
MEKLRPSNFDKIMQPCYRTTLDPNSTETRV